MTPFIFILSIAFIAAITGNWAQWRTHQERITPMEGWRAWSSSATSDVVFHPERFTPEGRRWRKVALASWATLFAAVILGLIFGPS